MFHVEGKSVGLICSVTAAVLGALVFHKSIQNKDIVTYIISSVRRKGRILNAAVNALNSIEEDEETTPNSFEVTLFAEYRNFFLVLKNSTQQTTSIMKFIISRVMMKKILSLSILSRDQMFIKIEGSLVFKRSLMKQGAKIK